MKLLTKQIRRLLPPLYSYKAKGLDKTLAVVKFMVSDGSWIWYVSEGSPLDANACFDTNEPEIEFVFYGYVDDDYPSLSTFTLSELQWNCNRLHLRIIRDQSFTPRTLQELKDECERRRKS